MSEIIQERTTILAMHRFGLRAESFRGKSPYDALILARTVPVIGRKRAMLVADLVAKDDLDAAWRRVMAAQAAQFRRTAQGAAA